MVHVRADALLFFLALGCAVFGCCGARSTPSISAYQHKRFDSPTRVVNVRKIANRMFGVGDPSPASDAVADTGVAQARLLWRNRWAWNNDEHHRGLNYGLRGGPMVSLGVPASPSDRGVSIEARCAALQYALPEERAIPALPDEWMRERDNRVGVEGGVYLSIPLGK